MTGLQGECAGKVLIFSKFQDHGQPTTPLPISHVTLGPLVQPEPKDLVDLALLGDGQMQMQNTPSIRKHLGGSRVVSHCKVFFMVAAQRTLCYLGWGGDLGTAGVQPA